MNLDEGKIFILLDSENFFVDDNEIKRLWINIFHRISNLKDVKKLSLNNITKANN